MWQFDFGSNQLTIAPGADGLALATPVVAAGNDTLAFLVDTGSDGSLTIDPADLAAIGIEVDAHRRGGTLTILDCRERIARATEAGVGTVEPGKA